jgi:hypothetical protein
MTVAGLVLFQQPVADQQRDTTLADLDRRDHGDAPGAALTEASCTESRCWFVVHVTDCYYVIKGGIGPTFRYGFGLPLSARNSAQGPLLFDRGATLRCPQLSLYRGTVRIGPKGTRPMGGSGSGGS